MSLKDVSFELFNGDTMFLNGHLRLYTVLFKALLGSLGCTRNSYIPPCRGKLALSACTVSKFGKIFIFPLYYVIHFSHSFFEMLKVSREKNPKLKKITFHFTTIRLNAMMGIQMVGSMG